MQFIETPLKGAFVLEIEERKDDRGAFARTFCMKEFADHGLKTTVAQCNLSYNHKAGTLRGMHFQVAPATEAKLVRCTRGGIYDVIVDLRPESPTYLRHFGIELTDENHKALHIPDLFAHGYQTLTDMAEIAYQMSEMYTPGCARGIRHDDPALGIRWPRPVSVISPQDAAWPAFDATTTTTKTMEVSK